MSPSKLAHLIEEGKRKNPFMQQNFSYLISSDGKSCCLLGFACLGLGVGIPETTNDAAKLLNLGENLLSYVVSINCQHDVKESVALLRKVEKEGYPS